MKNRMLIAVLLFGMVSMVLGQDRNGGAFLRLGLGAKARALGGASVGSVGDGMNFFYNPASMAFMENAQLSLSYSSMSLDRRFNFVGFATNLKPSAGLAVGWINSGVADIQGYDTNGDKTEQLDNSQNTFYLSFANRFTNRVAVGLNMKLLFISLPGISTQGFGMDLAIMANVTDHLFIGASIQDAKTKYEWQSNELYEQGASTTVEFPTAYKIGTSYRYEHVTVLLELESSSQGQEQVRFGVEYDMKDQYYLRGGVGVLSSFEDGTIIRRTPSFGLGYKFSAFDRSGRLDYAFVSSVVDEGASHVFSWIIDINK